MNIEKYNIAKENLKKRSKKINDITSLIILAIYLITIIFLIIKKVPFGGILVISTIELIFCIIITLAITSVLLSDEKDDLNKLYIKVKGELVKKVLKKYFTNITYNSTQGLTENFIQKEGLLSTGDMFFSNDRITGTYKDINFCQSDIRIEEEHQEIDNDGNIRTYYETVFEGRWLVFDFNKEFKSNLIVESGYFSNIISDEDYEVIQTESKDFNNSYEVYAQDEHEAFYILTPSFMEKITNIESKLKCAGIRFLFHNNKLHIGINNSEDALEFHHIDKISEEKIMKSMENDIKIIIDLINELDLSNDLFKK